MTQPEWIPVRRTRMWPPPCGAPQCLAHYPPGPAPTGCICTSLADETGWHLIEHRRICTAHNMKQRPVRKQ